MSNVQKFIVPGQQARPKESASEAKQDDLITALGKAYNTNEILEAGTDTYFCKETKTGLWYIMKIDTNSVFTHATILNNSGVATYADARSGYAGLTYQTYDNAFD